MVIKAVRFNEDFLNITGDKILYKKGNIYKILDETETLVCIEQFEYPETQCWMAKSNNGKVFNKTLMEE